MTLVLRRLFGERHAHTGEQPTKIAVIARHRATETPVLSKQQGRSR